MLILGLLIAFAARVPLGASMALVGLFALVHGCAHGAAMPETAAGLGYGPGFALATALLHGAGIGVGLLVQKAAQMTWLRLTGAAIALTGGVLIFA